MKKIFLAIAVVSIALLFGCIDGKQVLYKDIPGAIVPSACEQSKDDACALFECMVDSCWCAPEGVLKEGGSIVQNEQQAISAVQQHAQSAGSEYNDVRNAVQLNTVFWNVFAFNPENDEAVFTVAVDGTIMKTQCGV